MLTYFLLSTLLILSGEADIATRAVCPTTGTAEWQCSTDCKQYGWCDGNYWIPSYSCPTGQLCVNGGCGNYASCPGSANVVDCNVKCSDPSLKMPNVNDATSQQYYTCNAETTTEIGCGVLQSCASGQAFYPCTGQCVYGAFSYTHCDTSSNGFTQILLFNPRLAYTCTADNPPNIIWTTCDKEYFQETTNGLDCLTGLPNVCTNGQNEDNDKCTPGYKSPVTDNNCVYLLCAADGTSQQYRCGSGYHFDEQKQSCVVGQCSG